MWPSNVEGTEPWAAGPHVDPQTTEAQELGSTETPWGPPLPSTWELSPSPGASFAPNDHSIQERLRRPQINRASLMIVLPVVRASILKRKPLLWI